MKEKITFFVNQMVIIFLYFFPYVSKTFRRGGILHAEDKSHQNSFRKKQDRRKNKSVTNRIIINVILRSG